MAVYDLYGFGLNDIDGARVILEFDLGIQFEAQNSDYESEYYKWGKTGDENFILKRNVDPFDGEPAELVFPDYPILLYVNNTPRSKDLQARINKRIKDFDLLRHEDLK